LKSAHTAQYGYLANDGSGFYVPTFLTGAHIYAVQLVYSNEQHACSSAP
jgi:hypothetical protein